MQTSPRLPVHAETPVVSIVMPTFNRASLLPRALNSVLAQTLTGWELVIVDDGSDDETFPLVDRYLREDGRIRYLRHRNRRQSLSRNAGIQASVGTYVTFLDSDDEYRSEHLASRVAAVGAERELLQGGFEVVGPEWVTDFDDPERRISIYECVVGPTFFGRREIFLELGGYRDGLLFEDTEFWRRASARFKTLTISSPRSYVKHQTDDSLTARAARSGDILW